MNVREKLTEGIEWWLNGGPGKLRFWNVGIDIDPTSMQLTVVGIRLFGKSRHRKYWTRVSVGTHIDGALAGQLGLEGCAAHLAGKLRTSYREYANMPHRNINVFRKRPKHRALGGMR